jgi:hypothetical protein
MGGILSQLHPLVKWIWQNSHQLSWGDYLYGGPKVTNVSRKNGNLSLTVGWQLWQHGGRNMGDKRIPWTG